MAIRLIDEYPGKVAAPDANYPDGAPRNITVPADGTGTPWEQAYQRDIAGLLQKLLLDAGITASGNPDTVLASDYVDALDAVYGQIPDIGRQGLRAVHDTTALHTTLAGKVRNVANTRTLTLAASLQKNILLTWAEGAGLGGRAATVVLAAGWLRKFLCQKPGGGSTVVWDSSATAANFFASAVAIAAGYTDVTLYRRISRTYIDAGLTSPHFLNDEDDTGRYTWGVMRSDHSDIVGPDVISRKAYVMASVPPGALFEGSMQAGTTADSEVVLVTEGGQADTPPTNELFTILTSVQDNSTFVRGLWRVNASQEIFARSTSSVNISFWRMTVERWFDNGISA